MFLCSAMLIGEFKVEILEKLSKPIFGVWSPTNIALIVRPNYRTFSEARTAVSGGLAYGLTAGRFISKLCRPSEAKSKALHCYRHHELLKPKPFAPGIVRSCS